MEMKKTKNRPVKLNDADAPGVSASLWLPPKSNEIGVCSVHALAGEYVMEGLVSSMVTFVCARTVLTLRL